MFSAGIDLASSTHPLPAPPAPPPPPYTPPSGFAAEGVELCSFCSSRTCPNLIPGFIRWTCLTPSCVRRGTGGNRPNPRRWGRWDLCLTLHCHHQNDFYIKMGSAEGRCTVSFTVTVSTSHNCFRKIGAEEGNGTRYVVPRLPAQSKTLHFTISGPTKDTTLHYLRPNQRHYISLSLAQQKKLPYTISGPTKDTTLHYLWPNQTHYTTLFLAQPNTHYTISGTTGKD